jgi:hypothetical protein
MLHNNKDTNLYLLHIEGLALRYLLTKERHNTLLMINDLATICECIKLRSFYHTIVDSSKRLLIWLRLLMTTVIPNEITHVHIYPVQDDVCPMWLWIPQLLWMGMKAVTAIQGRSLELQKAICLHQASHVTSSTRGRVSQQLQPSKPNGNHT